MFGINSVLEYAGHDGAAASRMAVLWISPDGASGAALDLADSKSNPTMFCRASVERDLEEGIAQFGTPNFYHRTDEPSAAEIAIRDTRWAALQPILASEPSIYDEKARTALVRSASQRGHWSDNTTRTLLQTYWRTGKVAAALTPRYKLRGGPGVMREPGEKKLGRPRKFGSELGLNLNRDLKRAIGTVIQRYYRQNHKLDLTRAFRIFINLLFLEDGHDQKGRPARVLKEEFRSSGAPTLAQFKHHYYKHADQLELRRARNPRGFDLNLRPLLGSATAETWGPGSRFEIDATIADIYLVSRINRNLIVGRPVVYIVIDVWSHLIVGLYVAIEDASWTSAMMALANAACSKVEYCRSFGIEIDEDEWPAVGIGARLLSDHGEVDSDNANNLVLHFNRVIEVAEALRGDLKPLVECQFGTIQAGFGPFVPGYVEKDFKKRRARDYRLDALFDIYDFTQTMIELVLDRNARPLASYDRDTGMPADAVLVSPIELYHWGLANRSGRAGVWPDEVIRFRLMPTDTAPVDRNGIRFQGRHYIGDAVIGWMSDARIGRTHRVTISYDARDTDFIYLHDPAAKHGFQVCRLHPNSRALAGATSWEVDLELQRRKDVASDGATSALVRRTNVEDRMIKRVAAAQAKMVPDPDTSVRSRIAGIKPNRAAAKSATRAADGKAFRPHADQELVSNDMSTAIDTNVQSHEMLELSLADFMGDDDA